LAALSARRPRCRQAQVDAIRQSKPAISYTLGNPLLTPMVDFDYRLMIGAAGLGLTDEFIQVQRKRR
jgi:hypothetical protein